MKEFIEKLIGRLEEGLFFCECSDENVITASNVKNIVNQLVEEYKTCYKSCAECEAYDKVKHHCPKFCYIISETVKEIEENNKGGWIPCSSGNFSTSEVLVCKEDGTIDFDVYDFMDEDWKFNRKHHKNKVIAWQPLPEPYKESE